MIFSKKYKVHWQKFQKYDYYIFQLKWSLCQRTERWEVGERAGWQQGRVVVGPCWRCRVCGREPWSASPGGSVFHARLRDGQVEPRRKCCAVGLPLDIQRTTAKRHSVDTPPPHPTLTQPRLTGLAVQRVSETTDTAKSRASKESKDNNFWSNSDNHVDIVQRRGKNQEWSFSPPKVQWYSSVLFPFSLLPEEQRQTRFHGIDTVHKRAVLFLCCFHRFCCSFLIYWIAVEAICSS